MIEMIDSEAFYQRFGWKVRKFWTNVWMRESYVWNYYLFSLQYVYNQVAKSYNLSSDNGSLTDCDMNTSSPEYLLLQQVQSEATLDMLIFQVSGTIQ